MDFIAIDFETANNCSTSACSIGIAVVENNEISDVKEFLIKPYPDYFNTMNIRVHGITKNDVAAAPTFDELWPEIRQYMDNKIVAAHYAPFDMGVLSHTLEHYGIEKPEMDILCSCRLAKYAFPSLPSHSLDKVCAYLSIPLNHHRADSDAAASAQIICNIWKEFSINTLEDIKNKFSLSPGFMKNGVYQPFRSARTKTRRDTI